MTRQWWETDLYNNVQQESQGKTGWGTGKYAIWLKHWQFGTIEKDGPAYNPAGLFPSDAPSYAPPDTDYGDLVSESTKDVNEIGNDIKQGGGYDKYLQSESLLEGNRELKKDTIVKGRKGKINVRWERQTQIQCWICEGEYAGKFTDGTSESYLANLIAVCLYS